MYRSGFFRLWVFLTFSFVLIPWELCAQRNLGLRIEGTQISGELNKVNLGHLLAKLLQGDGSRWEVSGDLAQPITIRFQGLTLEESVQKAMRISGLNHAIVWEYEPGRENRHHHIEKLTVYEEMRTVHFSRVDAGGNPNRKQGQTSRERETARKQTVDQKTTASETSLEDQQFQSEDSEGALREFINLLSRDQQISSEQQERLLEEMEGGRLPQ